MYGCCSNVKTSLMPIILVVSFQLDCALHLGTAVRSSSKVKMTARDDPLPDMPYRSASENDV